LDRARADAADADVSVEYMAGDMRQIPWTAQFDRVINWSTAFGYFDDTTNRAVLQGIAGALRPGGRLAMDLAFRPPAFASWASCSRQGIQLSSRSACRSRPGGTIGP
jgi:SAM-dependent methyltransferase